MSVRRKCQIHEFVEVLLSNERNLKEWEPFKQFFFGPYVRFSLGDQKHAVDVVRFHRVGYKTPVQYDPPDARPHGEVNHLAD